MSQYKKISPCAISTEEISDLVDSIIAGGLLPTVLVPTFADLPATANPGELRYVEQESGSYLTFNKKKRGWYQWDGSAWQYAGDNTRLAVDTFYDNATSGLTSMNVQDAIDEIEVSLTSTVKHEKVVVNLVADTWIQIPTTFTVELSQYKGYSPTGEEIELTYRRISDTVVEVCSIININNVEFHLIGE